MTAWRICRRTTETREKAVAANPAKQACPVEDSMCFENSAGKKLKKRFHREDFCRPRLIASWNPGP
jgi:hypothetical protein